MTDTDATSATLTSRPRTARPLHQTARVDSPRMGWRHRYVAALVAGDLAGIIALIALVRVSGMDGSGIASLSRYVSWIALALAVLLVALFSTGAYEVRRISVMVEEGRRLFHGVALTVGVLAVVALLAGVTLARRVVIVDVTAMLVGIAISRAAVRAVVRRRRARGEWSDRVLAAGTAAAVADLIRVTSRRPLAGLTVVAACVTDKDAHAPLPVPVVGGWTDITSSAEDLAVDVVALAGANQGARAVRELGWSLEGSRRQLVTALELSDISRSRIEVRPVDGAPLAWVGSPQFTGPVRIIKRIVDVLGAAAALLVVSPLLLAVVALIKTTSRGPVLFRQTRLGKDGRPIEVLKFRTMVDGADAQRDALLEQNLASNLLYFKVRDDPRITGVGRFLRRYSIDEVPQLFNVFAGSMSLVGPRPLPGELDLCDGDYRRRLLVKPGLTGLWQVSGRNDLPTEEALRLDLYYVENWSMSLDLVILLRTVWAVLRKQGAY